MNVFSCGFHMQELNFAFLTRFSLGVFYSATNHSEIAKDFYLNTRNDQKFTQENFHSLFTKNALSIFLRCILMRCWLFLISANNLGIIVCNITVLYWYSLLISVQDTPQAENALKKMS